MDHERRRYLVSGRVQGVGFRMTTRRIAQAHPVTGYVRNLPDGRVEILAEGEPSSVAAFLGAVRREFEGYIEAIQQTPATENEPLPQGFSIRH